MLHDGLIPPDEKHVWQTAYGELAGAVGACLEYLRVAYHEAERAAHADGRDIHASPLMMVLDFIDTMDGVFLLIRAGSSANCTHLLRAALELRLSLGYLMETAEDYERRSVSYEYWHHLGKAEWLRRCNPKTERGREFYRQLQGDEHADVFDISKHGFDVQAELDKAEAALTSPRYAATHAEYEQMRTTSKAPNNWFSLWGGPKNLRELSARLGFLSLYEALYRSWSASAHGEASMKRVQGVEDGKTMMRAVRSPEKLPEQTRHACNLTLNSTRLLIEKLATSLYAGQSDYYVRHVRPALAAIDKYQSLNG